MTCPQGQQWHLLSLELLDEHEAEALRAHAQQCESCGAAYSAARRDHVRLLRAFEVFDRGDDRFREQLVAALPEALAARPQVVRLPRVRRWLGDFTMATTHRRARWLAVALAPAACVALALILVLTASPRLAFAQVVERMRAARTMVCQITTNVTMLSGALPGQPAERVTHDTLKMYSDGQTRAWLFDQEQDGQHTRTLMRPDGSYVTAGDRQFVISRAEPPAENEGPVSTADWVEHLLKLTEEPDRRLGEEQIAGRAAVGFEIAGWKLGYGSRPTATSAPTEPAQVRVWVDTETRLPVRLETDMTWSAPTSTMRITSRWDELQWDVPLDAADFEPPPAALAPETPRIELPAVSEATAIESLRAWLEAGEQARATVPLLEARAREKGEPLPPELETMRALGALDSPFPERLNMDWLMPAFMARSSFAALKDQLAEPPAVPEGATAEERAALVQQRAREAAQRMGEVGGQATARIMPLAALYQRLAHEERQPEYFPQVTPGDGSAILLRWRTDDGQLRVIYGDLRAATIPANE